MVVETVRMSRLIVAGGVPGAALFDSVGYPVEVAVEPVHAVVFYLEPSAAVDPGSPVSEIVHQIRQVTVVQLSGQQAQKIRRGRISGMVVNPEVYV